MKEIALITVHGIRSETLKEMAAKKTKNFSVLEAGLKKQLEQNWDKISFQNVEYASILQEPQDALWEAMIANPDNDLDSKKLRQLFLFGFGDASSLEYSAHCNKEKYIEVQQEIQRALKQAYVDLGEDKNKPIVILAHSLGCQVMSNYIWDANRQNNIFEQTAVINDEKTQNENEFLRLKSLSNLVTTGCNIPLFVSGISQRSCFEKPNAHFLWDNYYDSDDILGWPLRQLGDSFDIVNDHSINTGTLLTCWNPLSHTQYWSDKDVINPLAKILLKLL